MISPPTLPQPNPSVETLRPVLPRFLSSMRVPPVGVGNYSPMLRALSSEAGAYNQPVEQTLRPSGGAHGPLLRHREQPRARAPARPRRPPERRRAGSPARRRLDGRRSPGPPGFLGPALPDPDRALGEGRARRGSALDRRAGRGLDQRLGQGALPGAAASRRRTARGRRRRRGRPPN